MRIGCLIAVYSVVLQGCAFLGIAAVGNRSASIVNPNISVTKKCISENNAEVSPITSNELLTNWGEPNVKRDFGFDDQVWRYNFGRRWKGVVIGLIIPIPLMVPVGYNYIEFHIHNDNAVSAFMTDDSGKFGLMIYAETSNLSWWDWEESDWTRTFEIYNDIGFRINYVLPKFSCHWNDLLVRKE